MAMQVKHVAKDAAQKWEDEALCEAHVILAAAVNGPLTDLVLPPLPLALLEVHKSLHKRRPMNPSDIQSPFAQASTSPWAVWMAHEDDPEIPSQIDLGDPSTFWWEDLEERTTKTVAPVLVPLKDEVMNPSCFSNLRVQTPPPAVLRDRLDGNYWRKQESDTDEQGSILAGGTVSASSDGGCGRPLRGYERTWTAWSNHQLVINLVPAVDHSSGIAWIPRVWMRTKVDMSMSRQV
ncbi:hypothetical protein J3R83DRAFT_7163 [Lanmaoa asiatica]|nr:hypothetical protein J3R83DRAFT_7163 [Lanmaoa asiatica]